MYYNLLKAPLNIKHLAKSVNIKNNLLLKQMVSLG